MTLHKLPNNVKIGNIYTVDNDPEGLLILYPIVNGKISTFHYEHTKTFSLFKIIQVLLSFFTFLMFFICFLKVITVFAVSF